MLKCNRCFFEKLPSFLASETEGYLPPSEQQELVHITLAQSLDAVTVKNGEALCETHLHEVVQR